MRLTIDGQAWNQGFHDGESGKASWACPYPRGTTDSWSWSSGYIEGNAARQGYAASHPYSLRRPRNDAPAVGAEAAPLRCASPAPTAEDSKQKEGVNIARRSGVKVRRRLTF